MKIHTWQLIDRYTGIPLCGLISLLARRREEVDLERVERILVVKFLGLGSIIVMSPMLRNLRRRFPSARIDFLTMKNHAQICRIYDLADNIYPVDFSSFGRFFADNLKTIAKLRKEKYDLIIDAEFYSRYTAILSYLSRPKIIVGFHSRELYRGNLRQVKVPFNLYRHMTENFLELAGSVGASREGTLLTRPGVEEKLREERRRNLAGAGIDPDRPYILLNPHASNTSYHIDRRWPLEYFRKIGVSFRESGYQVVVLDAPGRSADTESLVEASGGKIKRLPEETGLAGLPALIEGAFLMVTNDSGPMHMAVSVGTPTFSFFGTETPVLYGYSSFPHTVFYEGLACSPCLSVLNFKRGRCDSGVRCIREITPEKVLKAFSEQEEKLKDYRRKRKDETP